MLRKNIIGTMSSVMIKKDAILEAGGFNEDLRYREDLKLIILSYKFFLQIHQKELLHQPSAMHANCMG